MKIFDITRTIQEAPLYPGTPPFSMHKVSDLLNGDEYNESEMILSSHMGTHADAASHYLQDACSIETMPLERYLGPCTVMTIPAHTVVSSTIFRGKIEGISRLVLHGGGNTYLSEEAATYLVQCGVQTIVTDAWSIAPLDREAAVHHILLEAGVAIVENVILDNVPDGRYQLSAFPLRIAGCDGAPVRAVLFRE